MKQKVQVDRDRYFQLFCAGCPNSPSSSAQCPATNVGSIQGDAFGTSTMMEL